MTTRILFLSIWCLSASALEMRTLTRDLIKKYGAGVFDAGAAVCLMTEKETTCYVKREVESEVREFSLGNPNWISVSYLELEGRRPFCLGYDSESYCVPSVMKFSNLPSNWIHLTKTFWLLDETLHHGYPTRLGDLTDPEKIQVNPLGVCWQETKGTVCSDLQYWFWGVESYAWPLERYLGLKSNKERQVFESPRLQQVSMGGLVLCGTVDGEVVCQGTIPLFTSYDFANFSPYGDIQIPGFYPSNIMPLLKVRIQNPSVLSAGLRHMCSLGEEGVQCWGSNQRGQLNVPSFENPTQLTTGAYYSCVRDGSHTSCWGEVPENLQGENAFTFPIRGLTSKCRLNHERIECSAIKLDFNFSQWDRFSKNLEASIPGIPAFDFSVATLSNDLRKIAEAAYPAKKKLLEATASLLEKEAWIDLKKPLAGSYKGVYPRLVAMAYLEPLIQEIAGGDKAVIRRYQEALQQGNQVFGFSKAEDIEALPSVQKVAVQMILLGLQGAKSSIASTAVEGNLSSLITEITKVLAVSSSSDPKETSFSVAGLIQKNTGTVEALLQEPRARTFAELSQSLARYLLVTVQ